MKAKFLVTAFLVTVTVACAFVAGAAAQTMQITGAGAAFPSLTFFCERNKLALVVTSDGRR